MTNNSLTIQGLSADIAYCEALGLSNCFEAYSVIGEQIMQIGFNPNSGYVYIALENGITICSNLGNDVEYLVTDYDNGQEYFFAHYADACGFLDNGSSN